jgi:hypothetical protein
MIPLLRLIGMIAPLLGVLFFCFLSSIVRSIEDPPPRIPGIILLVSIVVGSFTWMGLSIKWEKEDRRLWDFLFVPQPGPASTALTRTAEKVHLRMPDEYRPEGVSESAGALCFLCGMLAIFVTILTLLVSATCAYQPVD